MLALAATGLLMMAIRLSTERRDWLRRASDQVTTYRLAQQSLQLDLLNARAGLLRNYDPVNAATTAMRDSLFALERLPISPGVRHVLHQLEERCAAQEILVEGFKSANALLQNSLTRFAANEGAESEARRVLSAQVLRLTLDTSPRTVLAAQNAVDQLPEARGDTPDGQMIAHARLLVAVLPQIDAMLHRLRLLNAAARTDALDAALREDALRQSRLVRRVNLATAIAMVLLAGASLTLILLHRLRTRELHAQAANERLSAAIAIPLIDSGHTSFRSRVQDALHRLASHIEARRIQLLVPGLTEQTCLSWPDEAEARWLPEVICAADKDQAWVGDRLVMSRASRGSHPTLDASLRRLRIDALVLLRTASTTQVVIGIEPRDHASAQRRDHLAGIASATIAIAHGARREVLRAERERLEQTLARARRMETIGAMASGVAHNFNNIMGAISGFAEMAQERIGSAHAARHPLREIGEAVARAQHLVGDILTFAKQGRSSKAKVELDRVVRDCGRLFLAATRDPGAIHIVARSSCSVLGAEADLQQVFLNICNNARQAGGERPIAVVTGRHGIAETRAFSHGALDPGCYATVTIDDDGPGVASSACPRLFEPFFTSKPGGTGLGLSTAWEIVQDHGGTIDVGSGESGGARFTVWLPIAADGSSAPVGDGTGVLLLGEESELAANEDLIAGLGYEPSGFALSTSVTALAAALSQSEAVLIVSRHAAPAATVVQALTPLLDGRTLLLSVKDLPRDNASLSAILLRYPLDENELAGALARLPRIG
ncbi:DAHL domain-containing protein [Sphingomonas sp. DT-51]|uniref:DAHL domain-containing protein n=1 Tax=Sphingomonas sp. DT-51 TaxID=3396165 RepID=UPI003F1BF869